MTPFVPGHGPNGLHEGLTALERALEAIRFDPDPSLRAIILHRRRGPTSPESPEHASPTAFAILLAAALALGTLLYAFLRLLTSLGR
jgi:hypothetical protein